MGRFGLVGFPVAHSLSPVLFDAAYHGRHSYETVETGDFSLAMSGLKNRFDAINVTMPFKTLAAENADIRFPEVRRTGAANILLNTPDGIVARNSDFMAVRTILAGIRKRAATAGNLSAAVIGTGGAGKAAIAAAVDNGMTVNVYRHDEISGGVKADVIIYALPCAVDGFDRMECRFLLEANYKDPCLNGIEGGWDYISGLRWLTQQGIEGYELMTGEKPDAEAMLKVVGLSE